MTVRRAAPPAAVAVLAALLAVPGVFWPVSTLDEAILLVYPQRMLAGDLPYRDFFAAYGPTFWWSLEGWYAATSLTITSLRVLGVVVHVALALGVYRLLLPSGRGRATVGGLLAAVLLFRLGANPYAWLVTTTLCLWQLAVLRGGRRPGLAGVLGGLAVTVRPDVALLALLSPIPLLRGCGRRWAGGVMVGLLPLAVGLAVSGPALVDQILLGRAGAGAAQSRLPFVPQVPADRVLLAMLLACVLLTVVTAVLRRERWLVACALLGVLALPQAFQRADPTHFVFAGLLAFPLLPATLSTLFTGLLPARERPAVLGALAAVFAFLVAIPSLPQDIVDMLAHGNMRAQTVRYDGRSLPEAPQRAAALRVLLPAVRAVSRPGQTLFVFDSDFARPAVDDVSLYYFLHRWDQHAFTMEITPGVTNQAGSRLRDDVAGADVIVLVDTPADRRAALFPYEHRGSDEAERLFRATFCRRSAVDVYEVWTRCA